MELNKLKGMIYGARSITVLTGAGISAESGVPIFRGTDGLWKNYRAEDLATLEAFRRDPEMVWRWYDWRRGLIAPLKPNPGHIAIARLEKICEDFFLITQNVDGLHEAAGSSRMVEIHGNIWHVRCARNCSESPANWEDRRNPLPEIPPKCPYCGGLLRPHVVWFGENLDPVDIGKALEALKCEIFMVVGTSGMVQPAASFAFRAGELGAKILEFNVEQTPISLIAATFIKGKSGETLQLIIPVED